MRRVLLLALVSTSLFGCVQRQRPSAASASEEWAWVIGRAHRAAGERKHTEADSLLSDFTARHESAPEAREAHYWRAIFLLDPANAAASPRRAVTLLDQYLAFRPEGQHRLEAGAIRRVALLADSVSRSGSGERAASRDEEVQRLREELKKSNEELERIKRRLSAPKP